MQLDHAVEGRHRGVISLLCSASATLGIPERRLASVLCEVVSARDNDLLSCYVLAGADLSAADYDWRTALHVAAVDGNVGATAILLSGGAPTSAVDRWGRTPLDEATSPNNPSGSIGRAGVRLRTAAHVEIAKLLMCELDTHASAPS